MTRSSPNSLNMGEEKQDVGASADADRATHEPSPKGLGPDGLRSPSGVVVTEADREAAWKLAERLGVPDITGPRNQDEIAEHFARYRMVSQHPLVTALDGLLAEIQRILWTDDAKLKAFDLSVSERAVEVLSAYGNQSGLSQSEVIELGPKHTPLPWVADGDKVNAGPLLVATCSVLATDKDDAAFIARACNSYYERAEQCQVPPEGWYCTRAAGHDGPCAAHPEQGAAEKAGGLWYRRWFKAQTSNNELLEAMAPLIDIVEGLKFNQQCHCDWGDLDEDLVPARTAMENAQAIETRRAETGAGSVEDESAVRDSGCAQTTGEP